MIKYLTLSRSTKKNLNIWSVKKESTSCKNGFSEKGWFWEEFKASEVDHDFFPLINTYEVQSKEESDNLAFCKCWNPAFFNNKKMIKIHL